jgi:O-acetyl-ADP-ribose deacetylase (regulator of RNase III)
MLVVPTFQMTGPRWVIHFPTKKHWRSPSKLDYIDAGLADLSEVIKNLGLTSIAVPPLGAGNGGLDWATVHPRIEDALADLPSVDVHLYAPSTQQQPTDALVKQDGAAPCCLTQGRVSAATDNLSSSQRGG